MRAIDDKKRKFLQLNMLDYINQFCKENGIKYSIACGTLLGAVRHKGFIPWDDDIDIYILRSEYDKFIELFSKSKTCLYRIYSLNTDTNYNLPYAKICDNRTLVKEQGKTTTGLYIDIFPIDQVPDNKEEFTLIHKKILQLYKIQGILLTPIKERNSSYERFKLLIRKIQYLFYTSRRIAQKIDSISRKCNQNNSNSLFELVAGRNCKDTFAKEDFKTTVTLKFEDKEYQAMIGYQDYLTKTYGDFMTPPPIEKQVSNHKLEAYWIEKE